MYVVRAKRSKTVLHTAQSAAGEELAPEAVYPEFDPETMEFGRSDEPAIPAWFTIEDGMVKAAEPPEEGRGRGHEKTATPPLDELKAFAITHYSDLAFQLRRALIPDYKLQNAALGVYDESETAAIRDTVKAFRDEFHRLKSAIEKARSIKALKEVTPNFPTAVVSATLAATVESTPTTAPVGDAEPTPAAEPLRVPRERVRRPNP